MSKKNSISSKKSIKKNSLNIFRLEDSSLRGKDNTISINKNQQTEKLIDPDVAPSIKKIIERLSYLYNQHKDLHDKSKKKINSKMTEKNFIKISDILEMIYQHKILLNKCQMGLSSSFFLSTTLETLILIWSAHFGYRTDILFYIKNNLKLSNKWSALTEEVSELEIKKVCFEDEIIFYREMKELYSDLDDEDYLPLENEIWELLLSIPVESSLPIQLIKINQLLTNNSILQVESQITEYLIEGRTDEYIGLVILNLGKRCLYLDANEVALRIVRKSISILKNILDKKSLKFNLLSFAEAFVLYAMSKSKEAAKLLININQDIKEVNFPSNTERAFIGLFLGYFMLKWKENVMGYNVLEQAISILNYELPQSEVLWTKCCNLIARFYNEDKKTDLAYSHLVKVLDYYHEKYHGAITQFNKPIYMVASESRNISKASMELIETLTSQMVYLPKTLMKTLKELVVTFAIQGNINAVDIVEKYINDSYKAYENISLHEGLDEIDNQTILNRLKYKKKENDSNEKKIKK